MYLWEGVNGKNRDKQARPRRGEIRVLPGQGRPGEEKQLLLEFQHFLFLGLAHLFHLLDFVIGELLDLVE